MNRRKFLRIAGASLVAAGSAGYLFSDRNNAVRADVQAGNRDQPPLEAAETEILYLASLAPSGHNTQPWIVKYQEPYRWVIGNDPSRWLPAVDPSQRETILSIGAFLQNLEYAAGNLGYQVACTLLADTNQDADLVEITLKKTGNRVAFNPENIQLRRTIRSGYLDETIRPEHINFLTAEDSNYFQFVPNTSREYQWLNEQTIEANRRQAYRDDAQAELGDWIRFSSKEAHQFRDGLTTASMEITGVPAWVLRNFYTKKNVMSGGFREQSIDKVKDQVRHSGGWLLLSSRDNSTAELLESGKRLQRMLLRTREKNIAIHPMTQILEEEPHRNALNASLGISSPVQFILRTGYVDHYPSPVSLRRPVESFVTVS